MRFAVLIDGGPFGDQVVEHLRRLNVAPALILRQERSTSILKRLRFRCRKYGVASTFCWALSAHLKRKFLPVKTANPSESAHLVCEHFKTEVALNALRRQPLDFILNAQSSILPKAVLSSSRLGTFGLHPGKLPTYVGLCSVEWQVFDRKIPQYSIFRLDERIDNGPIYQIRAIVPEPRERAINYSARFLCESAKALAEFANSVSQGRELVPLSKEDLPIRNRGLMSPLQYFQFWWRWRKLPRYPIEESHQTQVAFADKVSFERWAKKSVRVFLGAHGEQFEKLIDWGEDTGKPVRIPKSQFSLKELPRITHTPQLPVVHFEKNELPQHAYRVEKGRLIWSFDLISAVGWLLGGFEEYFSQKRDKFGRWSEENSIVSRDGLTDMPVINAWIVVLSQFLKEKKESLVPLWPDNKSFALAISHDLDNAYYNPIRYLRPLGNALVRRNSSEIKHYLFKVIAAIRIQIEDRLTANKRPVGEFIPIEKSMGLTSTAFLFSLSSPSSYSSPYDPRYELEDPKILQFIDQLKKHGVRVGVHAAVQTAPLFHRYAEQVQHLEKLVGGKVHSLRHHYWNLSRQETAEAWQAMATAGISVDSSLAFYQNGGFRRSVAFPFRPFHPCTGDEINLLEVPPTLMDRWAEQQGSNAIERHLDVVRAQNGVAVLNWHCNRFHTSHFRKYTRHYWQALKAVKARDDVWLATIEQVSAWWKMREDYLTQKRATLPAKQDLGVVSQDVSLPPQQPTEVPSRDRSAN